MVYLWLQPFQKSSLKKRKVEKLQPCFFIPYKILHRIGELTYELELPPESKTHNTFHVSLLKRFIRWHDVSSLVLPPLYDEGWLVLIPKEVLETKVKKLRNRHICEHLIKWKDLPIEDSTWEGEEVLAHPSLSFLRAMNPERGAFMTSHVEQWAIVW